MSLPKSLPLTPAGLDHNRPKLWKSTGPRMLWAEAQSRMRSLRKRPSLFAGLGDAQTAPTRLAEVQPRPHAVLTYGAEKEFFFVRSKPEGY